MINVKRLIFDADDTLWENNKFFINTTESFFNTCVDSGYERKYVVDLFRKIEFTAVKEKGYGSETFIFILETLFSRLNQNRRLNKNNFGELISIFKSHTETNPPLFPGVAKVLDSLNKKYELFILTKGNIAEQQKKINRSGLKIFFKKEFVLPEKNDDTYLTILKEHNWIAEECCMIGNSPKSDINPALRCGMYAVYIPYAYTWHLDDEQVMKNNGKLSTVKSFIEIPEILSKII